MHFLKSESYNLSPDEYLHKFQTPHSVISSKGSTDLSQKDMHILQQILQKSFSDNTSSGEKKQMVVHQLDSIVKIWLSNNSERPLSQNYGLKIFGSYSLKANSYDGDIDMICIVPENFSREKHFFGLLVEMLKKNENISELFPIPDAHVPIIKFLFYDVQIDLLFCRLPYIESGGQIDFLTGISLMPITEKELKSLNGYRTSIYLKNKLPNYKNFQVTLKALKMWARNKGIYSQIYGYLGGAGFSIMLAKICQLYPNYSVLQLLDRFFFIYANWVWTLPIALQEMPYQQIDDEMTIYTPFQPYINAAHDVSKITSFITKKQLKSASRLIQDINKGKKSWKDLFQPFNFFQQYRYFLQISVMGEKKEDFIPWKGNIESKMRKLIKFFEQQQDFQQGIEINPYPKSFTCKHENYSLCAKYYMGLKISPSSQLHDGVEIDLSPSIRDFVGILETYPNIQKTPKLINVGFSCIGQEHIPGQVLGSLQLYE